jgi:predicted NUDIX family NTP pyrophosphohydrolase
MKESAGTLLYRRGPEGLEVLLVHASGSFNRHRPWSIPKVELDGDEDPAVTARRETLEETGVAAGDLVSLGEIVYTKTRKRIRCFAGPAPEGAAPLCASWEVDRAEFVSLEQARKRIHPDQAPFLDRLAALNP